MQRTVCPPNLRILSYWIIVVEKMLVRRMKVRVVEIMVMSLTEVYVVGGSGDGGGKA